MIDKPAIIITSTGRSGTKFFSSLFNEILYDCNSLHEPDIFSVPLDKGFDVFLEGTREKFAAAGWKYLVIQKIIGNFSLVKLSDLRLKGLLSTDATIKKLFKQRKGFVKQNPSRTYLESSAAYYGLIDVLPEVFINHRVAYIARDGRDWVRSFLNWGEFYDKGRIRGLVAHTWPKAGEFPEDPFFEKWEYMNRFERLCWAWNKLNGYAISRISKNPNSRLFRFEDLFISRDRYSHLTEFVRFLSEIHEGGGDFNLAGKLDKKVNESHKKFRAWSHWSDEEKRIFQEHCGDLMSSLSYEF